MKNINDQLQAMIDELIRLNDLINQMTLKQQNQDVDQIQLVTEKVIKKHFDRVKVINESNRPNYGMKQTQFTLFGSPVNMTTKAPRYLDSKVDATVLFVNFNPKKTK